jgi:hypothetical protein
LNPFLNIFKGLRSCARVNKLGLLLKAVDKVRTEQNRPTEDEENKKMPLSPEEKLMMQRMESWEKR